jgi:hypothetical protein
MSLHLDPLLGYSGPDFRRGAIPSIRQPDARAAVVSLPLPTYSPLALHRSASLALSDCCTH